MKINFPIPFLLRTRNTRNTSSVPQTLPLLLKSGEAEEVATRGVEITGHMTTGHTEGETVGGTGQTITDTTSSGRTGVGVTIANTISNKDSLVLMDTKDIVHTIKDLPATVIKDALHLPHYMLSYILDSFSSFMLSENGCKEILFFCLCLMQRFSLFLTEGYV